MEEASCTLTISVYDTERNEKAKLHRAELVRPNKRIQTHLSY
jgi:hypothetical protein